MKQDELTLVLHEWSHKTTEEMFQLILIGSMIVPTRGGMF